jgi:hypothetical protein
MKKIRKEKARKRDKGKIKIKEGKKINSGRNKGGKK